MDYQVPTRIKRALSLLDELRTRSQLDGEILSILETLQIEMYGIKEDYRLTRGCYEKFKERLIKLERNYSEIMRYISVSDMGVEVSNKN